jgi:hypothetical protein
MAAPASLAPQPGTKLDFMSLVDKEDPDDIYELIDELAVGTLNSIRVFFFFFRIVCVGEWLLVGSRKMINLFFFFFFFFFYNTLTFLVQ